MSEHVWTENTKPDRPGIWQNKAWTNPTRVTKPDTCVVGTWAFLMDLPDIKDPPKYRDVTPADVGKTVEVRDDGVVDWDRAKLIGFDGERVVAAHRQHGYSDWDEARILDDGQPSKQPPVKIKLGCDYEIDGKRVHLWKTSERGNDFELNFRKRD